MNCAVHPEAEASGFCRNCGKPMCANCVRPVKDVYYCEDCLASTMGVPASASAAVPLSAGDSGVPPVGIPTPQVPPPANAPNPGLAFLLGLIPGLGAIYNGEYNKALLHIVIFAFIIVGISSDMGDGLQALFIVAICVFPWYMAIDAMRVAKAKATGVELSDPLETWSKNKPVGPIILIGIGLFVLLHNFGFFDFYRVRQFILPAILIGVGFLMLRNRMGGQS
ncbi:MAG TPA: DUF5668 domain-containing protein [Dongiaceae bacterium]|nr:DUF5668 domain-containing protein [Dongiaceae bacterium]